LVVTAERTPLHAEHVRLGAQMTNFGGWIMPLQYSSIREEHRAVREAVGLFDLSHMGELRVRDEKLAQRVVSRDLSRLHTGRIQYALLCNEQGGIIDDVLVYAVADGGYLLVVNAGNQDGDFGWIQSHSPSPSGGTQGGGPVLNVGREWALVGVQGPRAVGLVQRLTKSELRGVKYYAFIEGEVADVPCVISRTGYTGEDGFELFCGNADAVRLWRALLENGEADGIRPAGLGARDTLRLEAGMRLYGNDMDETVNPYEAGLGWVVKLNKGDFVGRAALEKAREVIDRRQLIGLRMKPGDIPRHGATVTAERGKVGKITSGTHSFFLGYPVALALVEPPSFPIGSTVSVDVRGREAAAEVVELPFYRGSARATAPKHY